jgi:hypothetical protein
MQDFLSNAVHVLWTGKPNHDGQLSKYISKVMTPIASKLTMSVMYVSLYYIHKLSKVCDSKDVTSVKAVFVTALILGDIAVNDNPYSVGSWSRLSGIPQKQVIKMRREMLEVLGYNLFLSTSAYANWVGSLHNILAVTEVGKLPRLCVLTASQSSRAYPSPVSSSGQSDEELWAINRSEQARRQ